MWLIHLRIEKERKLQEIMISQRKEGEEKGDQALIKKNVIAILTASQLVVKS